MSKVTYAVLSGLMLMGCQSLMAVVAPQVSETFHVSDSLRPGEPEYCSDFTITAANAADLSAAVSAVLSEHPGRRGAGGCGRQYQPHCIVQRKRAAATVVERWYPSDPNEFSADLCREVEYPGMGGTWMDH